MIDSLLYSRFVQYFKFVGNSGRFLLYSSMTILTQCRNCDVDMTLNNVKGIIKAPQGRRVQFGCFECGAFFSHYFSHQELVQLREDAPRESNTFSTDEIGRLVQGFRIELDELNRDWDLIVADWVYTDEHRPQDVPVEMGQYKSLFPLGREGKRG